MNNNNNRRRGNTRQTTGRKMPVRALAVRNSRMLNSTRPERIRTPQNLLSVPTHSWDFKTQRVFRLRTSLLNGTASTDILLSQIKNAVRDELGISTTSTGGEIYAIHEARIYSAIRLAGGGTLSPNMFNQEVEVLVYDTEEPVTGPANLISRFTDMATVSGISCIGFRFPVNNRPTTSRSSTDGTIFTIRSLGSATTDATLEIVMDLKIDYTRVNGALPLLLSAAVPMDIDENPLDNLKNYIL
jgi:hypothetical protein